MVQQNINLREIRSSAILWYYIGVDRQTNLKRDKKLVVILFSMTMYSFSCYLTGKERIESQQFNKCSNKINSYFSRCPTTDLILNVDTLAAAAGWHFQIWFFALISSSTNFFRSYLRYNNCYKKLNSHIYATYARKLYTPHEIIFFIVGEWNVICFVIIWQFFYPIHSIPYILASGIMLKWK